MSQVRITKQTAVTFYSGISLADLRGFIAQCEGVNGDAIVRVETYKGDQREGSSTTITVHGAA